MVEKKWRTYIVLKEQSKIQLLELIKNYELPNWEINADHYTVTYGRRYKELNLSHSLGDEIIIYATHLGGNEHCFAIKVEGFYSDNSIKHITLLVNRINGGKPVMSNSITRWNKINISLKLVGVLTEFEK